MSEEKIEVHDASKHWHVARLHLSADTTFEVTCDFCGDYESFTSDTEAYEGGWRFCSDGEGGSGVGCPGCQT